MNDQPPEFVHNQNDAVNNTLPVGFDDNPPEPVSSADCSEPVQSQQYPFNEQSFDPVSSSFYSASSSSIGTSNFTHNQHNSLQNPLEMNIDPPREPSAIQRSNVDLPLPSCSNSSAMPSQNAEFGIDIPLEPSQGDELVTSTTNSNYQKHSDLENFVTPQSTLLHQKKEWLDKKSSEQSLNMETGTSADTVDQVSLKSQSSLMHPSDPAKYHIDNILLAQVLEYGFSSYIATLAIQRTGGTGVEQAVNWIIDHSNASDTDIVYEEEQSESQPMGSTIAKAAADVAETSSASSSFIKSAFSLRPSRSHKMIFVANMSLKMGAGKLAAQVGHATLGVYRVAHKAKQGRDALESWRNHGEVKIVVKGQSTEQLLDIFKQAKDAGLYAYLVQDAGYTQIPPGSRTVLAIFGPLESVDQITGSLKLL